MCVALPDCCPYPSFEYCFRGSWVHKEGCLNSYNTYKQPHPWSISYNRISYWSERRVEKKKNGKWGFIPPRLKSPREYSMHSQKVWLKKVDVEKMKTCSDVALAPPVTDEEQIKLDGKSSVIIKNAPNHFRFHLNLGFAFVNFTSPVAALRFYRAFNNVEWSCGDSRKKICQIGTAKFQGKDAFEEQFRRSSFPCHTNEYLPELFSRPRDGFNHPRPTLVGRHTHLTATPKDQNVMIMTRRRNKKV